VRGLTLPARDFFVYFIPGIIFLSPLICLNGAILKWAGQNQALSVILVSVASFLSGFAIDLLFHQILLKKVFRKIPFFREPVEAVWKNENPKSLIIDQAKNELGRHLDCSSENLKPVESIYFCFRYVQVKNERATLFLDRINTKENLCTNLFAASICAFPIFLYFSTLLFNSWHWVAIILFFICFLYALANGNYRQRVWFANSALRLYLILRIEDKNSAGDTTSN